MQAGRPSRLPPPVKNFEESLDPTSKSILKTPRFASTYGDPESVKKDLQQFIDDTGADEVIVITQIFEHAKRLRSYEIAAEVAVDTSVKSKGAA